MMGLVLREGFTATFAKIDKILVYKSLATKYYAFTWNISLKLYLQFTLNTTLGHSNMR